MTEEFNPENKCAHLTMTNDDSSHKLEIMFGLQEQLQENLGNNLKDIPWEEKIKKFKEMYIALLDEQNETLNRIAWKPWKKYKKLDLNEEELLELKYELVDTWFFLMNQCLIFGLGAKEFFNLYVAKQKENNDRIIRGYSVKNNLK